jgi:hypothetical protein
VQPAGLRRRRDEVASDHAVHEEEVVAPPLAECVEVDLARGIAREAVAAAFVEQGTEAQFKSTARLNTGDRSGHDGSSFNSGDPQSARIQRQVRCRNAVATTGNAEKQCVNAVKQRIPRCSSRLPAAREPRPALILRKLARRVGSKVLMRNLPVHPSSMEHPQ